ncbi:hypothetical protein YC2023_088963 [Brassica napus]
MEIYDTMKDGWGLIGENHAINRHNKNQSNPHTEIDRLLIPLNRKTADREGTHTWSRFDSAEKNRLPFEPSTRTVRRGAQVNTETKQCLPRRPRLPLCKISATSLRPHTKKDHEGTSANDVMHKHGHEMAATFDPEISPYPHKKDSYQHYHEIQGESTELRCHALP